MNDIMVDNWFMEDVIEAIDDMTEFNTIFYSESYANLLMAIVLWDNVYYPKNNHNWWNSFPSEVQNALQPIDDMGEEGIDQSKKLYYNYMGFHADDYYWYEWKNISNAESENVGCGALRYMMLSSKNGCDYLPCEKRQQFIREYNYSKRIEKALDRMKKQKELDKVIEQYYRDTYKALKGFPKLSLQMPVLVNYIFDNTPKEMTPVDYALHLKYEGPVIQYRKYLGQIEDALEMQNWIELRFLLRCSEDAVADVIALDKKRIGGMKAKIVVTPSVLLGGGGMPFGISFPIEKEINISLKKLHLTFLRDLTSYAINDMKFRR